MANGTARTKHGIDSSFSGRAVACNSGITGKQRPLFMTMTTYSVLFVCMGNICRSPTAHGVFRQKVIDQGLAHWLQVDSAGTHNYHPGSPPDERSQTHAAKRGYDLSDLRARQIREDDFVKHDLIL